MKMHSILIKQMRLQLCLLFALFIINERKYLSRRESFEYMIYHVAFDLVDTDFLLLGSIFILFKLLNPTFALRRL